MAKVNINNLSKSGIDVQALIDKLVEIKSIPIKNLEEANTLHSAKITKINGFLDLLKTLQEESKALFDYRSPFEEMMAISSNESILTAIANRTADIGKRTIKVIQTALSEKYSSDLLSVDTKIGKVSFTIKSGSEVKKVVFNGGNILDFVNAIKEQAGELVNINVIYNDKESVYVTIESKKEGESHKLIFSQEIMPLMEKFGFLIKKEKFERIITTIPSLQIKENPINVEVPQTFNPENKLRITLDVEKVPFTLPPPQKAGIDEEKGSGPPITLAEETAYPDPIKGDELLDASGLQKAPLVLRIKGDKGTKEIKIDQPQKDVNINVSELDIGTLQSMEFINSTKDTYFAKNLTVQEYSDKEGFAAKHPLQQARNAIIEVDGIRIVKETNTIDDVIKGVTLNLKKASDEEVTLNIDHNYDFIKEKIISWVGNYNNIIKFLKTETNAQKGADGKAIGSFTGDIGFIMLHNNLQKIMSSNYSSPSVFNLLSQIGISTGKIGSIPTERGGFLEIDEAKLDQALRQNPDAVKKLFGFDTDNDKIVDNGIGVKMFEMMRAMTNFSDGTIKKRADYYSQVIANNQKKIETLKDQLETYRETLIYKFAVMESTVAELKGQGSYLSSYLQSSIQSAPK